MQRLLYIRYLGKVRKFVRICCPKKRTRQHVRTNSESRFRMRENWNHGMGAAGGKGSGFENHSGPCFARAEVIQPCKRAGLQNLRSRIAFDLRMMGQWDVRKHFFRESDFFENSRRNASTDDLQLARSDFQGDRSMHTAKCSEGSFDEQATTANGPAPRYFPAVVDRCGFSEIRHDGEDADSFLRIMAENFAPDHFITDDARGGQRDHLPRDAHLKRAQPKGAAPRRTRRIQFVKSGDPAPRNPGPPLACGLEKGQGNAAPW